MSKIQVQQVGDPSVKKPFIEKIKDLFTEDNTVVKKQEPTFSPMVSKTEETKQIKETNDLFNKILSNQKGKDNAQELLKLAGNYSEGLYKADVEGMMKDLQFKDRYNFLQDLNKELNLIGLESGVIDKVDLRTAKKMLEESTYEPQYEKGNLVDGLKRGLKNQIEGIQYAGIALGALVSGNKSLYTEKAGMDSNASWWDIATDLMWMGDIGSTTGGKMFAVDLLFLVPGVGALGRTAIKGVGTTVLKQAGKTVLKGTAKTLEREAVEAALKSGAKLELKGIGANATEKQILKMAQNEVREELAKAGSKLTSLPVEAVEKKRAEIILNGFKRDQQIKTGLNQIGRIALDVLNVPYNLSGREIWKFGVGYGMPVGASLSGSFGSASEYFVTPVNKAVQMYAQYNTTKYEKELAQEFTKYTGLDPLTTPELAEEWSAYKTFKIRNEGATTILNGEKEGSSQFGSFFLDTILNLGGMGVTTKVAGGVTNYAGNKLNILGASEITKQVDAIQKKYNLNKFEDYKTDVSKFQEDVSKITENVSSKDAVNFRASANNIIEKIKEKAPANVLETKDVQSLIKKIDGIKNANITPSEKIKETSIYLNQLVGKLDETSKDFFAKEVSSLTFSKSNIIEDVKMMNRVNDLLSGIINRTEPAISFDPKIMSIQSRINDLMQEKVTDVESVKQKYNQIGEEINYLIKNLEYNKNDYSVLRQTSELKKIAEHFSSLEAANTTASRFRLAVTKNLAKGTNAEARKFLGGMSAAEIYASRYPGLASYISDSVVKKTEIAKDIADKNILEAKRIGFIRDLFSITDEGIRRGSLMPELYNSVSKNVDKNFADLKIEVRDDLKNAIVNEGVIKLLEVYNTISKNESSVFTRGRVGSMDFTTLTKDLLSDTFGFDVIEAMANKKNKTISKFLAETNQAGIKDSDFKTIEKITRNNESIFNNKSESYKAYKESYSKLSNDLKSKVRDLAESEKNISDKLHSKLMETSLLENKLRELKANGIEISFNNDNNTIRIGNKEYKNGLSALRRIEKETAKMSDERLAELTRNPEILKSVFSEEDKIKMINNDLFQKLVEKEEIQRDVLKNNIGLMRESFLNTFELSNPKKKITTLMKEALKSSDNNRDVSSVEKLIDLFTDEINSMSYSRVPKADKIQEYTQKSRKLNDIKNVFSKNKTVEALTNLSGEHKKKIIEINKKINEASNIKDVTTQELNFLAIALDQLDAEIKTTGLDEGQKAYLENKKVELESKASAIKKINDLPYITNLEKQTSEVGKYINQQIESNNKLLEEASSLLAEKDRALRSFEAMELKNEEINNSIKKLKEDKAKLQNEVDYLNGEIKVYVDEISRNPFDKEGLVDLAKESINPESFYKALGDRWKNIFGEPLPDKYLDYENSDQISIFNALNQTSFEQNGKPREFAIVKMELVDGKFKVNVEKTTDPKLVDGTGLRKDRVTSNMETLANEAGRDIIEIPTIVYKGVDTDITKIIYDKIGDPVIENKYASKKIELKTQQDKELFELANKIEGKAGVANISNKMEIGNSLASTNLKVNGKQIIISKDVLDNGAKTLQASVDANTSVIGGSLAKYIYSEILTPIKEEAEKQGMVLIGSIDDSGNRLFMTTKKETETSERIFKMFNREVLSKEDGVDPKIIKRHKQIGTNEIHVNVNSFERFFGNLEKEGYKPRKNKEGKSVYRFFVVDDASKEQVEYNKNKYVSTDGGDYLLPETFNFVAHQTGNQKGAGNTLKTNFFQDGKSSFVNKPNTLFLDNTTYKNSIFSEIKSKYPTVEDLGKEVDGILMTKSIKNIGITKEEINSALNGNGIIEVPVEKIRVKKLSHNVKTEVSASFQVFTSLPRNIKEGASGIETGDYTKQWDLAMDEVGKIQNEKINKISELWNTIRFKKVDAAKILADSDFSKIIASEKGLSKVINDIYHGGGYNGKTKALFDNTMMNIFVDEIVKLKVQGTDAKIMPIHDYKNVLKTVESLSNKQGLKTGEKYGDLSKEDFIILERKNYKNKIYQTEDGPKVISYRYPVSGPMNLTVDRVVWAEDLRASGANVGYAGNEIRMNMKSVFINKQGDFDADTLNIIYDPKLGNQFFKLVEMANKIEDFKIDPSSNTKITDKYEDLLLGRDKSSQYEFGIQERYFQNLFKIKNKDRKMNWNKMMDHIKEQRQIISQKKKEGGGNSFIERLYMLDGFGKIELPKISQEAEKSATSFATKEITKKITGDIKNLDPVKKFDGINKELSKKLSPINERVSKLLFKEDKPFYIKEFAVSKENGLPTKIPANKSLIYYEDAKEKLLKNLEDTYQEKTEAYWNNKKLIENRLDDFIVPLRNEYNSLKSRKSTLLKEYEAKAKKEIIPLFSELDPEMSKNVERYIMSKTWGKASFDDVSRIDSKAAFLIGDDVYKEYMQLYNTKYTIEDYKGNFGIIFDSATEKSLHDLYNRYSAKDLVPADKFEIEKQIDEIVKSSTEKSKIADRKLTREDLKNLGSIGDLIQKIVFGDKIKAIKSIYTMKDIYEIKDAFDKKLERLNPEKISELIATKTRLSLDAKKINHSIFTRNSKNVTADKKRLNNILSNLAIIDVYEKKVLAEQNKQSTDATLKQEYANPKSLEEYKAESKKLEYELNRVQSLKKRAERSLNNLETSDKLLSDISNTLKEILIRIRRLEDGAAKDAKIKELSDKIKAAYKNVTVELFRDSIKQTYKDGASGFLKKYNYIDDLNAKTTEANKQLSKMVDLEPQDFLSRFSAAMTQAYKNTSVGIAIGRTLMENVNTAHITMTEAMKQVMRGTYGSDYFKKFETQKNIKNFMIPKAGEFESSIMKDYGFTSLGGVDKKTRIKIIDKYVEFTTKLGGKISGGIVNYGPKKWAQKYYEMKFNEKLLTEINNGKTYLLQDPSKISFQRRNEYNKTMNYIKSQAKLDAEKSFFNYDTNPLIAHKLEAVMPFTNFMFSGIGLLKRHPKSILGMSTIIQSYINNYGDQVGFVLDDEDGNPIRTDFGKRIKFGLLGSYTGFTGDLSRMLQFSPTDAGISMAPIFSYMSGDADWRMRSWMKGDISGMELALGAISPSISSIATGFIENDRAKLWNGLSYFSTGWATKSTANQELANDFYINQDYKKIKDAPDSIKKRLTKMTKGVVTEDVLDSYIKAQELGLISKQKERSPFGTRSERGEEAFKESVKLYGQLITVGTDGVNSIDESKRSEEGKKVFEMMKWVVGSDFFGGVKDKEWMKKVSEFVEDGHLDNFEKANPAYGKAMRHYYDNREYYAKKYDAYDTLSNESATNEEKLKANALLVASNYELAGVPNNLDSKIKALMSGEVQFILDEQGRPEMTKERLAEIDYKGFYVKSYEEAVSKAEGYRNLSKVYLSLYWAAKDKNDSAGKREAWSLYKEYETKANQAIKEISEHHSLEAEMYVLKNMKAQKTQNGAIVTEPIQNYMNKRSIIVNDFYNEMATDRIKFLENTENLKWNSMSNEDRALFRILNGGKTFNQAKEDLATEKEIWRNLYDSEIPKQQNDITKLIDKLYE